MLEVSPLTKPLSDVGKNNRALRMGILSLPAYLRTIGNDGGAGRRPLCVFQGRAWELRGIVFGMQVWR